MKLLIDAHCFDYKTSEGINTYIKGLYSELVKIATDIDFYFAAQNTDSLKRIFGEAPNVNYISLTSKNKFLRLLFEFPLIIKKYRIDAAHYQYIAPILRNCKNIVTLHDILFIDYPEFFPKTYKWMKTFLFKISAQRADMLLTVSEYSKQQISKHYHIPLNNIQITPNAVSNDFRNIDKKQALQFVKDKGINRYILYVSRIEPRKNQFTLLRSYCELKLWKQSIDLVFIGKRTLSTHDFDNYYSELADDIKSRIHIYDQVDYEDLKYWYKAASLFVYPAYAEGFGIPPIEASAAGIPVICSNMTAMSDFSFYGNNHMNIYDSELLKTNILKNLVTPLSKDELMHISDEIFKKYDWQKIACDYYTLLKQYPPNHVPNAIKNIPSEKHDTHYWQLML